MPKEAADHQVSVAGDNTREVPGDLRLTVVNRQED
jgi:hypothetical protein